MLENQRKHTVVVLGNGPSVDAFDPRILDFCRVIGTNSIFRKFETWKAVCQDAVITDAYRLKEIADSYAAFPKVCLHVGNHRAILPSKSVTRALVGRDFVPIRQYARRTFRGKLFEFIQWPDRLRPLIFNKLLYPLDPELGFNFGQSVVMSAIAIAAQESPGKILLSGVDARYDGPQNYFGGVKVEYVNTDFVNDPRTFMEPFMAMARVSLEKEESNSLIARLAARLLPCVRVLFAF